MIGNKFNTDFKFVKIAVGLLFSLVMFPSNLKSIVIFISGIIIVTYFFRNKRKFQKRYFLLNGTIFLLLLGTILYSNNLEYAFKKLQTLASLIVFPLFFSVLNYDDKKELNLSITKYLKLYIISVFLFNIIPFLWFYITNYTFSEILQHFKFIIIVDFGKYTIHPIYMSMHCCLAIIFSMVIFSKLKRKSEKFLHIIINVILLLFVLLYAKKGPIIAFLLTITVWFYFEYKKHFKYNLLIVLGLIIFFAIIPTTRKHFLELANIEKVTVDNPTSTNIRYTIYQNSFSLIKKSLFLGYGIGDYNDELRKTFKKNAPFLSEKSYNSHNQYISFTLIGGLGLLISFLIFYGKNLMIALQSNNIYLILILIFYGVMMFFENILEREHGVIFFSLFLNFFAFNKVIKPKE